jgi:hypothetical protein
MYFDITISRSLSEPITFNSTYQYQAIFIITVIAVFLLELKMFAEWSLTVVYSMRTLVILFLLLAVAVSFDQSHDFSNLVVSFSHRTRS